MTDTCAAKNVSSSSPGGSDPKDELVELRLQEELMQVLVGRRENTECSTVWFFGLRAHKPVRVAMPTPLQAQQWAGELQNWTTEPVGSVSFFLPQSETQVSALRCDCECEGYLSCPGVGFPWIMKEHATFLLLHIINDMFVLYSYSHGA